LILCIIYLVLEMRRQISKYCFLIVRKTNIDNLTYTLDSFETTK